MCSQLGFGMIRATLSMSWIRTANHTSEKNAPIRSTCDLIDALIIT